METKQDTGGRDGGTPSHLHGPGIHRRGSLGAQGTGRPPKGPHDERCSGATQKLCCIVRRWASDLRHWRELQRAASMKTRLPTAVQVTRR